MQETALIVVHSMKNHALYGKRFRVSHTFTAHNPVNKFKLGDVVVIEEHRPISKTKRWMIVEQVGTKDLEAVPDGQAHEPVKV